MEMGSLVGFRFKPTNEEIIRLLKKKRLEPGFSVQTVKEIDFYNFDPWELSRHSEIESKERTWYFYCRPYYKYANSKRSHRRTNSGYWKITGKGSDMKAKNKKDVIGRKRILSFYLHGATIFKEAKPEWVMHEIYIKDDPRYKEDFVVCRLERKRDNKPSISTNDEVESSHLVVVEDSSLKFILPPNQQLVPDRNGVPEKTSLLLSHNLQFEDQPPSQYLTSDYSNHDAERTLPTVECQQLPSHYFNSTSDYINHFQENIFLMDEFQQLPSFPLTSDFSGQIPEHCFLGGESLLFAQFDALQGSNGFNYYSLPALLSLIDVEEGGLSSCNGVDQYSFFAQQSPINPVQRTSSYFGGFSDYSVLDFQFDKEQEDLNSQGDFRDKYPLVETGNTPSSFNSSKSVTEVHFDGSTFTNTETVNAWVNGYSPIDSGDYYFDSIWDHN